MLWQIEVNHIWNIVLMTHTVHALEKFFVINVHKLNKIFGYAFDI